ncbi:PEP-CTERM sorting domain-containing protein, partial [bacterium]
SDSITAFGVNLFGVNGYDLQTIDFTVGGSDSYSSSLMIAGSGYSFFGVIATDGSNIDALSWKNVTGGDTTVGLANVDAVPEPASMAALGLGGLALLRRRRKA